MTTDDEMTADEAMKTDDEMTADEAIEEAAKVGEYLTPTNEQSAPDASGAPICDKCHRPKSAEFSLQRLGELAQKLVSDGAVPRDMKAGHVLMAMQAGIDHGLSWLGGIQGCVVIHGNFSWKGLAAAALIRNSVVCKPGTLRFWCDDKAKGGGQRGVAVAWRVGYAEPDTRIFTMEDARRAELLGGKNWKHYPDRMLMWRALGLLSRDIFSDVLGGYPLVEEESIDFDPKRKSGSTPQKSVSWDTPPPSSPDTLLDAIEGKERTELNIVMPEPGDVEKVVDVDRVDPSRSSAEAYIDATVLDEAGAKHGEE